MTKRIELPEDELLVTSTNSRGILTYVNDTFVSTSNYDTKELLGVSHNVIRHEDMPKVIFKLLWEKIKSKDVIYYYIKNRAKNGDYYWAKAFITPVFKDGKLTQVTSYRKIAYDYEIDQISKIYNVLLNYERTHTIKETESFLNDFLNVRNLTYEQMVNRISKGFQVLDVDLLSIDIKKFQNEHIIIFANLVKQIKRDNNEIKLLSSCECGLGKWIKSVKNKEFTKDIGWNEMLSSHENLHKEYESCVNVSNKDNLEKLQMKIEKDTQKLFEKVYKIVDKPIKEVK